MVLTIDSHDNKLYKQQIVRIIVSPICCWLLRLASKEPEYAVFLSCLYPLRQPCPARLGETNTTARILRIAKLLNLLEIEKSCGGDSSLHPQDLTFQGRLAAVVPLHDKKRHQGLCISMAYEE